MSTLRIAFAGDRDLALPILRFIIAQDVRLLALLLPSHDDASHAAELRALCPFLPDEAILEGWDFRRPHNLEFLASLHLDYLICIHYPYIIPERVLTLPRIGVLNLHPAYLPYNRGWHTPSWAILEETPIGATLHFMDAGVDSGDIVARRSLEVSPGDTANSLYQRLKALEVDLLEEAWPQLESGCYERHPQRPDEGTSHRRRDLFSTAVQRINLDERVIAGELLRRLRALTTNHLGEAAYFEVAGKRFRVQVVIHEEPAPE